MALFSSEGEDLHELVMDSSGEVDGIQTWIEKYPDLLKHPGLFEDGTVRNLLLIRREAPIAGNSLDHLFVDQEGVPTLVEAKLASNKESRRNVVAQMLDYAANAESALGDGTMRSWLTDRCESEGLAQTDELAALQHSYASEAAFWGECESNLNKGRVRLVFALDSVPEKLKVILEFLNRYLSPVEVVGLEVNRYSGENGDSPAVYETNVIGQGERIEKQTQEKRSPAIETLMKNHLLEYGQELWLIPSTLPQTIQPEDKDDLALSFELIADGGSPKLRYRGGTTEELVLPSLAIDFVRRALDSSYTGNRAKAVHDAFALEPGGKSLGEILEAEGYW
jgi:hypothetical protein